MFSAAYPFLSKPLFRGLTVQLFMLKKIALCLCFTLFLGLVTACSPKGMLHLNGSESPNQNQPGNSENGKNAGNTNPSEPSESTADSDSKEISAPIAIPPSFGDNDPYAKPDDQGFAANQQSGIPGLQPMKGVNVDTLFAEKLKNSDERFDRLENTVLEMRKEINNVMPSIVRLVAIEGDIQNLTKELDGMLQETPPANTNQPTNLLNENSSDAQLEIAQLNPQPPPPPDETNVPSIPETREKPTSLSPPPKETPTVVAPPPPQAAKVVSEPKHEKQKAVASNEKIATSLRLGEYDNKVRIVIDTSKTPNISADYDPEEHLVVLEISDAKWIGDMQKTFADSKLVQSYSVSAHPDGNGATIAITLKKDSKILKQGTVEPDDNPNYRFYLDLSL